MAGSSIIGNPIVISGPYTGKVFIDQVKSVKAENIEWYSWASGATATMTKKTGAGKLYAHIRPTLSGITVSRDLDGIWFRDPYMTCTSGVMLVYRAGN
jgi:hypothetical protein